MNFKSLFLQALKGQRQGRSLWALFDEWLRQHTMPVRSFTVLVYGPPRSGKTRIVEQFGKRWPQAIITERVANRVALVDARAGAAIRLAMMGEPEAVAGFDLVIQVVRQEHYLPNLGLRTHWDVATIVKSRFTVLPFDLNNAEPLAYGIH